MRARLVPLLSGGQEKALCPTSWPTVATGCLQPAVTVGLAGFCLLVSSTGLSPSRDNVSTCTVLSAGRLPKPRILPSCRPYSLQCIAGYFICEGTRRGFLGVRHSGSWVLAGYLEIASPGGNRRCNAAPGQSRPYERADKPSIYGSRSRRKRVGACPLLLRSS